MPTITVEVEKIAQPQRVEKKKCGYILTEIHDRKKEKKRDK